MKGDRYENILCWSNDFRCLYPTTKISQEAYNSYDKAVKFCEGRADNPIKIDDYTWKSEQYKYTIIDLDVL